MNSVVMGLPRELDTDELIIGSDDRSALVAIPAAESIHAVISYRREGFEDGQWWIENRSRAGTFLNGARLDGKALLSDGDRIALAGAHMILSGGTLREDHGGARGVTVDVRNLSDTREGHPILRSVSFSAHEGEFVGILGPSGCGKSSVIQRIAGLAGFSGSITLNGHSVSDDDETLRRLVAYLPQNVEDSLHAGLSVREEMACARRIFLASGADDGVRDSEILKTLDLCDALDKQIGKLSGGQKRRVAIALALLRQPRLLLFDEPTAGLDPATETEVMNYLRRLSRQGRTVVCATHVMENVSLFDKVLVMASGEKSNGGCAYFGSPEGVRAYFGVDTYPEMYACLKDDSHEIEVGGPVGSPRDQWELPEAPRRAPFCRTVVGYLRRSWMDFCASFRYSNARFDRWMPAPFRAFFVQPLLIAIGIKWGCAKMFSSPATNCGGGISTVLFCAALSVFWIGLVGNVQALVRERIPGRCLDRLGSVSLASYGTAKIVVMACSCAAKTFVFTLLFFSVPEIGAEQAESYLTKLSVAGQCEFFGVLLLVCLMGGMVGLAVSAVARKAVSAVSAVPVVAILALFFSQPVIGFDMGSREAYGSAEKIAEWMPCYWPQVHMSGLVGQDVCTDSGRKKAPQKLLFLSVLYVVVAAGAAFGGQRLNERAWEGR